MNAIHISFERLILVACISLSYSASFAQKPTIREIDRTVAGSGEVISLQGTFINDKTKVSVAFGAVKGEVQFASDQLLEVAVPPGTTYAPIVVTDLTSGLNAQLAAPFLLSFGGSHGVTAASLEGQVDFSSDGSVTPTSKIGLYDFCMCDFDGDGKTDIATANDDINSINIFANTTPNPGLGNISFNRIPFLINTRSLHARCGDLNGDGKPDLVISEGGASGDRLFVFRNTSTGPGSFTFSIQAISLPGKKVKRTSIADLDNDGKPELIVTNQTGGNITILANQSTTANIVFAATAQTITIPGAASTDGLALADFDGDGLPDIATSQFLTQTSNVFILQNKSVPGNIVFAYDQMLDLGGTVVNLKTGDLDGDGKPEIAATQLIGAGTVSIFRNTGSGNIAFASPVTINTDARPWGLDFGDIDGDGKTDIVVASLEKSLTILNNESTSGTLKFNTLVQPTTYINRHPGVGDVDGDGKPDIVFTSVDDNNNNVLASKISVLRNKHCIVPSINPAGPIAICTGFPLRLTTTSSKGTTYEWRNGGATVKSGPDPFFDVTTGGSYTVVAVSEGGTCSETSNSVTVTVDPGITSGTAVADNDGPVCVGSTASIWVNDVGGTAYNWTGPNGYTSTGLNPSPINNFQTENAGRYYLDVVVNGCIAQQTSTVVEMISTPDFAISYTGSDVICPPDTKTLSVVPNHPDFTYQWAELTTGNIAGATGASVSVTTTGEYFVKATYKLNPACATITSDEVAITFSTPPTADFSVPLSACTSQVLTFVNQTTGDSNADIFYTWSFGDTHTSTEVNPTYQYSTPNTYSVTLTAGYANGACQNQVTKNINIAPAPSANIVTATGNLEVCDGGALELSVDDTFDSYQWSTGETTSTITIAGEGNYSVDLTRGSCLLTRAVTITALPAPDVVVTADPEQVMEGGTSQLNVAGLSTYAWTPPETLNNPTIANPVASPVESVVYTVTGTDENGCPASATVEVRVKGDLIVNKLFPSRFISPNNGDAINNYWLVENILTYPQCAVTIYDDKGIKVYDAKPYNNDWAGTFNGKELPDGVYYYLIRCDGEESTPRAGSITILR